MPTKSIQIRYNHTEGIRAAPHPLHQTPPGKLGGGTQGGPGDRHLPTWSPKPLKNHLFWSRGWSNRCSHNEIYDIGTEILLLTKNDHNSTQKAPKSIIPQEIKSAGHSPSSGSVKTRFKTISKKWPSWIRSSRNLWTNVSEYISEYVSEYTSKYVSEYQMMKTVLRFWFLAELLI